MIILENNVIPSKVNIHIPKQPSNSTFPYTSSEKLVWMDNEESYKNVHFSAFCNNQNKKRRKRT